MKVFHIVLFVAIILTIFTTSSASSQAYPLSFDTSITFQNVGTSTATVTFSFYNQGSSQARTDTRTLAAKAGDSYSAIATNSIVPPGFWGSARLSANQSIVATLVQLPPSSSALKNRPLSNATLNGASQILIPTLLKNTFNTTSKFAIQNLSSDSIDITVNLYNASNPTAAPLVVKRYDIAPGLSAYFDMGNRVSIPIAASNFNGSAVISAVKTDTTQARNVFGTIIELSTNANRAKAFESVTGGTATQYMPSALCNDSDGLGSNLQTAFAVQNVATSGTANVTIYYSNGVQNSATVAAGAKVSFNTCTDQGNNAFSGAARIEAPGGTIVAMGKAFQSSTNLETAYVGQGVGSFKLALPYIRYASNSLYNNGSRQRSIVFIQNVGTTNANVTVRYINKVGTEVGTHTINNIAPGTVVSSRSINAGSSTALQEFGNPEGNGGAGYGGGVIIESTRAVVTVARVYTRDTSTGTDVAEDYNGTSIP